MKQSSIHLFAMVVTCILSLTPVAFGNSLDSYTTLLIQSNSDAGFTVFTDSSANNHSIYSYNAQHDTATAKFGKSSIYFNGQSNCNLQVTNNSGGWNFGTGDFTIDFWINPSQYNNNNEEYIGFDPYATFDINHARTGLRSGAIEIRINNVIYDSQYKPNFVGTWKHIAVVRQGNSVKLYVQGQHVYTATIPNNLNIVPAGSVSNMIIGETALGTGPFLGYMDEIRVSKGIARWTSNFTPPPEPYLPFTDKSSTIAQIGESTGSSGQSINNLTPVAIEFDTEDFMGSFYNFDYSINPTRLEVNQPGTYEVNYSINWSSTDSNRKIIKAFAKKNGTETIQRSESYSYARNLSNPYGTNSASFFISFEQNDFIEIFCEQAGNSGIIYTIPGESWLNIKRLE